MNTKIFSTVDLMGLEAARDAEQAIVDAIDQRGEAFVILATGASQFSMLKNLIESPKIDWSKVSIFHLDEYIGLDISHPASFRRYLKERVADHLPTLREFNYVDPNPDPQATCDRLGAKISAITIDVACIGIGENGHIAFNDPPADFSFAAPYHVVDLDERCRRQQLGEGWFPTLDDVPRQAISMSCREIIRARKIVCTVPDQRKAQAVADTINMDVTPNVPATILHTHPDCTMYLDEAAASLL